jgi:hypothetical protein
MQEKKRAPEGHGSTFGARNSDKNCKEILLQEKKSAPDGYGSEAREEFR